MKKTSLLNLRKGFTLIELLVVITVIAILAAIAVPATTAVLRNARTTESISNVRNIITAMVGFSAEKGRLPGNGSTPATDANGAFEELFDENQLDSGGLGLFFVAGITDTNAADSPDTLDLPANTNAYDYVAKVPPSGDSGTPIIMDASSKLSLNARGGDAIVGTLSAKVFKASVEGTDIQNKEDATIIYNTPTNKVYPQGDNGALYSILPADFGA